MQTFPEPSKGKWQVTPNGGITPMWRRDSKELYYLDLDGKLMAVTIHGGNSLGNDPPVALFPTAIPMQGVPSSTPYEPSADGRKFLTIAPASVPKTESSSTQPNPIVAMLNWTSTLRKN